MSSSEAGGQCKDGFPELSRCVPKLEPAPKAEASRLHRKARGVFQPTVCAVSWDGNLARTVSLIVTVPWDPGMQATLVPESGNQGESPGWQLEYYFFVLRIEK